MNRATPLPLVIPCDGATRAARLAGRVAQALDDLGVAEVGGDLEGVAAAARSGRTVVALDGCSSGCRARLLEARRIGPRAALDLARMPPGGDGADPAPALVAATAAALLSPPPPVAARGRAPGPTAAPRAKRAHVPDDYLIAIDALSSSPAECGALVTETPALAAHVSRLLAVSRPTAGEMLDRLEKAGLVARGPRRELVLTPTGRVATDRAVRRHRLLETFAVESLGYGVPACHEQARLLAPGFDDEAIERLRDALGDPERCPHGWPVDPADARAEGRALTTLPAVAEGARAVVVCVSEHDARLLEILAGIGLGPGSEVTAQPRRAGESGVVLRAGRRTRRIDAAAAGGVYVRDVAVR